MASYPLEGDGIVESLYHYIHYQDANWHSCPNIKLPHTVIYKYCQPAYWFFTNESDGQLHKIVKQSITSNRIYQEFCNQKKKGFDVVAMSVSIDENQERGRQTTIRYFTKKTLHDFLFSRKSVKIDYGILQAFVPPIANQNSIIRAIWTPRLCIAERRTNRCRIDDMKFDLYERLVTVEGADHHSRIVPMNGKYMIERVRKVCNSIVRHIGKSSPSRLKIRRMIVNLKIDEKNDLCFLWASSVRLESSMKSVLPQRPLAEEVARKDKMPPNVTQTGSVAGNHFRLQKDFLCEGCGNIVERDRVFVVGLIDVIRHFKDLHAKSPIAHKDMEMPRLVHAACPNLTQRDFNNFGENDFLVKHKRVKVCIECAWRFTDPNQYFEKPDWAEERQFASLTRPTLSLCDRSHTSGVVLKKEEKELVEGKTARFSRHSTATSRYQYRCGVVRGWAGDLPSTRKSRPKSAPAIDNQSPSISKMDGDSFSPLKCQQRLRDIAHYGVGGILDKQAKQRERWAIPKNLIEMYDGDDDEDEDFSEYPGKHVEEMEQLGYEVSHEMLGDREENGIVNSEERPVHSATASPSVEKLGRDGPHSPIPAVEGHHSNPQGSPQVENGNLRDPIVSQEAAETEKKPLPAPLVVNATDGNDSDKSEKNEISMLENALDKEASKGKAVHFVREPDIDPNKTRIVDINGVSTFVGDTLRPSEVLHQSRARDYGMSTMSTSFELVGRLEPPRERTKRLLPNLDLPEFEYVSIRDRMTSKQM